MEQEVRHGEKAVSLEFKLEAVRLIKQRGVVRRIVSATDCACTELRACTSVAIARLIAVDVVFRPWLARA
jgi:transposase-like protein